MTADLSATEKLWFSETINQNYRLNNFANEGECVQLTYSFGNDYEELNDRNKHKKEEQALECSLPK